MRQIPTVERLISWYCRHSPLEFGKTRLIETYAKLFSLRGQVTFRTDFGAIMDLDLSQYIQRQIYFRGMYEKRVLDLINEMNNQNRFDLFLDVGANVGQHSLFAVMCAGIPRAISFEASPHVFPLLKKNIENNKMLGRINPLNWAVSDVSGFVDVLVPEEKNNGTGFIVEAKSVEINSTINAKPLEDFEEVVEFAKKSLMKVDVEGAELKVIRGASKLIRGGRIKAIIVEVCEAHLKRFGNTTLDLYLYLTEELGMNGFLISGSGNLVKVESAENTPGFAEMLFISDELYKNISKNNI